MSRLRRPFLYGRYFFVTVNLLPRRVILQDEDLRLLARSIAKMRRKHGFALTAWVFLPDHWHAIVHAPAQHLGPAESRQSQLDDLDRPGARDRR